MNNISPTYPLEFAIQIATEAGKILMKNYGLMQKLEWNKKTHFKTEVDDLSDKLIRMKIGKIFPQDNIYSEENDALEQEAEFSWVIDPLDGTIPYRYGITDHFSVCIGRTRKKTEKQIQEEIFYNMPSDKKIKLSSQLFLLTKKLKESKIISNEPRRITGKNN